MTDTEYPTTTAKLSAIDEAWIARFAEWNLRTFGPGMRTAGTLDHIRKECREIEADPHDPKEWVDIVLLAINGLVRQGRSPAEIIAEIQNKHEINEARVWPDWRSTDPEKAIEHNRSADTPAPAPQAAAELTRYGMLYTDGEGWDMHPFEEGEYVKYTDAVAMMPAPAPAPQVLDKPARVGAIVFRAGVKISTVIEAAQRLYETSPAPQKDLPYICDACATVHGGTCRWRSSPCQRRPRHLGGGQ